MKDRDSIDTQTLVITPGADSQSWSLPESLASGRYLIRRSLGQGAPDAAHHGPKPPVPVLVRSLLWLWLLLGLAALIAGLLVLRRLRARRQQADSDFPMTTPNPEEWSEIDGLILKGRVPTAVMRLGVRQIMTTAKAIDPSMFEKPADNRLDSYVFGQSLDAWPKATDTAHDKIYVYSGIACFI